MSSLNGVTTQNPSVYLGAVHLLRWISLPRLREHAGRTALTVVGICLGIAMLLAVTLLNRAVLSSLNDTVQQLAGKADLTIQGGASGFDESLFEIVRATEGVARATRVVEQMVRMRARDKREERVMVLGVDFLNADEAYFRPPAVGDLQAVADDPLSFLNAPNHLLLSRSLTKLLGYEKGQRLFVYTPHGLDAFESWGTFDDDRLAQAFGGSVAVMDYAAMQMAFERGRNIDRIDVALAEGAEPRQVIERLKARVGDALFVGKPAQRGERLGALLSSLTSGLTMASSVAVLVAMFLIYSTMAISVRQRRQEIGVLRALGMNRRQVIGLFTLEGTLLGSVGSALGICAGLLLSNAVRGGFEKIVSELFVQVRASELAIEMPLLLACFFAGVLSSALAALLAAREAARIEPTEALRAGRRYPAAGEKTRHARDAGAILAALASSALLIIPDARFEAPAAALACAMIVLAHVLAMPRLVQLLSLCVGHALRHVGGMDVRLANDNLRQEIDRASSTASALMLGVAMSFAFSSLVDSFTSSTMTWVDQMLPADLWITSAARMAGGNSVPMTDSLREEFAGLPGVTFVERLRMIDVDLAVSGSRVAARAATTRVKLIAMDTAVLGERARLMMVDGNAQEAKPRLLAGEVLISENLAQRARLGRGDELALATSRGKKFFRVAGVIVDYTSDQGTILLDRATYEAEWADTRVDSYKLYLRPGTKTESVRRLIYARWGEPFQLTVLTQREFRAEIRDLLAQTFGMMHGLELIAVVIAVLSVVNAIFANVLDRAREYGLLRAVGMLRVQVQRMVVAEAALIGLIGAVAGVLAGLAIGYVLLAHLNVAQTGWHLPYHPTLGLALSAAVPVVIAALAAGYYPARVASRHALANALAYE